MQKKSLSKLSTHWDTIEDIIESQGPKELVAYLYSRYFDILVAKIKKWQSSGKWSLEIDDLKANEIASDVLYEFIKNDYKLSLKLETSKGYLRGLFFTILKRKLMSLAKDKKTVVLLENDALLEAEELIDLKIDFQEIIERLKKEKPRLYKLFVARFTKGQKITDVAEELELTIDAVNYRLKMLREWMLEAIENKD